MTVWRNDSMGGWVLCYYGLGRHWHSFQIFNPSCWTTWCLKSFGLGPNLTILTVFKHSLENTKKKISEKSIHSVSLALLSWKSNYMTVIISFWKTISLLRCSEHLRDTEQNISLLNGSAFSAAQRCQHHCCHGVTMMSCAACVLWDHLACPSPEWVPLTHPVHPPGCSCAPSRM